MGLELLPPEILAKVFAYLSPNEVYDKFLRGGTWNGPIQRQAFVCVFLAPLIMRAKPARRGRYDVSQVFYSKHEVARAFTVVGFENAYRLLHRLISYNVLHPHPVYPAHIGMLFSFRDDDHGRAKLVNEIDYFVKLLEVLSLDNYLAPASSNYYIQLSYAMVPDDEMLAKSRLILHKVESLGARISKLLIQSRYSFKPPARHLHPSIYSNLEELYLWNNGGVSLSSMVQYLRHPNSRLRVLDLTANEISSLEGFQLPPTLRVFKVNANNLTSLHGPDYCQCRLQVLDASINALQSILDVVLPDSITTFKVTYNAISDINQNQIPNNVEVLGLSKNLLSDINHLTLPKSLRELHLNANDFSSFDHDFFVNTQLTLLDLSENSIDDLDDLGQLPASLSELMLDNNQIDYLNFNNVFTPSLTKLSMSSTGIIMMSNVTFPPQLKQLVLEENDMNQIFDVDFNRSLVELNLRKNRLTGFNLPGDNVRVPDTLHHLDLSDNPLHGIESVRFPRKLARLTLNDVVLDLDQDMLVQMPATLERLDMNNVTQHGGLDLDFSVLPCLKRLSLDRNGITLIANVTYPLALEFLSYEYNCIADIPFDTIPTTIKSLEFSFNPSLEYTTPLPYFPDIEYLGINGDRSDEMRLGLCYGKILEMQTRETQTRETMQTQE